MNFLALRERVQALVTLGGWSNAVPAPDYAFLVNEGLRQFTQRSHHNVENDTFATAVGTAEYSINDESRGWISLYDDATYGTTKRLWKTTEQNIRRGDPLWKQVSNGTPAYIWLVNENTVRLYVPPDAIETVYIRGPRHEPLLDADSDEPLVSDFFHEGIALFGAWYHGKAYARGEEREVVGDYYKEAEQYAMDCRAQHAEQDTGAMVRRIRRTLPDTLYLDHRVTVP